MENVELVHPVLPHSHKHLDQSLRALCNRPQLPSFFVLYFLFVRLLQLILSQTLILLVCLE